MKPSSSHRALLSKFLTHYLFIVKIFSSSSTSASISLRPMWTVSRLTTSCSTLRQACHPLEACQDCHRDCQSPARHTEREDEIRGQPVSLSHLGNWLQQQRGRAMSPEPLGECLPVLATQIRTCLKSLSSDTKTILYFAVWSL